MVLFAKVLFCLVMLGMLIFRYVKEEEKAPQIPVALIVIGLILVLIPQHIIMVDAIVRVIDVLGLISTLIGVGGYIVMKSIKKKKNLSDKKIEKEEKH